MSSGFQSGNMAAARARLETAMDELETFVNAATASSREIQSHRLSLKQEAAMVSSQLDGVILRLRSVLDE